MFDKLKNQINNLKRESVVIYYALLDKRTPILAKISAAITIGYLLSPIDLVPDFIPGLGLLDDLLLVPILIKITVSLIPENILDDIRKQNQNEKLKKKWYFAIPIVLAYAVVLFLIYHKIFKK